MAVWPGLTARTQQVFEMVGRGANPVQFFNGYVVRRVQFYHRKTLAVNTVPPIQQFFGSVTPSAGVSNWPSPTGLQAEQAMWLRCMRFDFDISQSAAGAAGAEVIAEDDTTELVKTAALEQTVWQLFNQGIVDARVGARIFTDSEFGLKRYAAGGGLFSSGAAAGTLTAEQIVGQFGLQNGAPHADNGYDLGWIPVLPNKAVNVNVSWLASTPATPNTYVINLTCILDGIIVYPQSL